MTFKEWYRIYNPELNMNFDFNLEELRSCWQAAYEEGYNKCLEDMHRKEVLDKLAQVGQDFDEYGHYGENNPPLAMSKVANRDYDL